MTKVWIGAAIGLVGVSISPNVFAQDGAALGVAATASGRPKECVGLSTQADRGQRATIWDIAREPYLHRYCDLLGRARGKLLQDPSAAKEIAEVADQVMPGKAAPWVVRARAEVMLKDYAGAVRDFDKARAIDPRSVEEASAMHDFAIALRLTGKSEAAINTYRALVPRLSLVPGVQRRAQVMLETASLLLGTGDDGAREAIALLTEARNLPPNRYEADVMALLALALDRTGSEEQGAAVADTMRRRGLAPSISPTDTGANTYLSDPAEAYALQAIAVEKGDAKRGIDLWEKFIGASKNTKAVERAKKHIEQLRSAAGRRTGGPPAPAPRR